MLTQHEIELLFLGFRLGQLLDLCDPETGCEGDDPATVDLLLRQLMVRFRKLAEKTVSYECLLPTVSGIQSRWTQRPEFLGSDIFRDLQEIPSIVQQSGGTRRDHAWFAAGILIGRSAGGIEFPSSRLKPVSRLKPAPPSDPEAPGEFDRSEKIPPDDVPRNEGAPYWKYRNQASIDRELFDLGVTIEEISGLRSDQLDVSLILSGENERLWQRYGNTRWGWGFIEEHLIQLEINQRFDPSRRPAADQATALKGRVTKETPMVVSNNATARNDEPTNDELEAARALFRERPATLHAQLKIKLKIGGNKASLIMDQMRKEGLSSSKKRKKPCQKDDHPPAT